MSGVPKAGDDAPLRARKAIEDARPQRPGPGVTEELPAGVCWVQRAAGALTLILGVGSLPIHVDIDVCQGLEWM